MSTKPQNRRPVRKPTSPAPRSFGSRLIGGVLLLIGVPGTAVSVVLILSALNVLVGGDDGYGLGPYMVVGGLVGVLLFGSAVAKANSLVGFRWSDED